LLREGFVRVVVVARRRSTAVGSR